jgi:hypothetical protein
MTTFVCFVYVDWLAINMQRDDIPMLQMELINVLVAIYLPNVTILFDNIHKTTCNLHTKVGNYIF